MINLEGLNQEEQDGIRKILAKHPSERTETDVAHLKARGFEEDDAPAASAGEPVVEEKPKRTRKSKSE